MYYLYCIKFSGVAIYVGVTKNPIVRLQSHCRSKKPMGEFLRKHGEKAKIEVLAIGSRDYIYGLEAQTIVAFATRHPLGFNIAAGGRGCRDPLPSTRIKLSVAIREKMRSPEIQARMSTSRMGNKNCVGRVQSAATRAKISEAATGRTHSAAARAKMSAARLGRPHSPEHRAKLSEAAFRRWAASRGAGDD